MKITKFLLFVSLLLITTVSFGQNRGSGSYSPSGLVQEFKDVVNNIKKEAELSRAVERNENIDPTEFRNASRYTVVMVFNHAVNTDNYDAAKVMLDYMYTNKYDKEFISKHKTMAMGRILKTSRIFVKRDGRKCYFKYDTAKVAKYAKLLIDKQTDLQYLYDKATSSNPLAPFDQYILINTQDILNILRNAKYK